MQNNTEKTGVQQKIQGGIGNFISTKSKAPLFMMSKEYWCALISTGLQNPGTEDTWGCPNLCLQSGDELPLPLDAILNLAKVTCVHGLCGPQNDCLKEKKHDHWFLSKPEVIFNAIYGVGRSKLGSAGLEGPPNPVLLRCLATDLTSNS